jgi:hypothetical protein
LSITVAGATRSQVWLLAICASPKRRLHGSGLFPTGDGDDLVAF